MLCTYCALIQHEPRFEPAEFATLRDSIASMITALDDAAHTSADPGAPPPVIVSNVAHNGQRGRPRHEIDPDFLREALTMGTLADIARSTGQSVRTVRRRALELGLVQPGVAPICHQTEADGSVSQVHQNQPGHPPPLSDDDLDRLLSHALQDFPNFGRRMLKGWLSSIGHEVPRSRIEASCLRIRGPPGLFGGRAPRRREYHVLGANSLWHHDGQHGKPRPTRSHTPCSYPTGLIRYKFVIHCFIDGKSRFVVGVGVHDNNRAATVLDLFLRSTELYGMPSRVRGDHGTENLRVAEYMEQVNGAGRGSYIWGR